MVTTTRAGKNPSTCPPQTLRLINLLVNSYEPYDAEPAYDEEEAFEPVDPDDAENPNKPQTNGEANGTEDPDAMMVNGDSHPNNVVAIEDPNQASGRGKKNAVVGLREKKIAEDKRSTTPYMTKYERARVLGTRALQIR